MKDVKVEEAREDEKGFFVKTAEVLSSADSVAGYFLVLILLGKLNST